MKNQRGAVYLETLIGFLPVFLFFLGTLQVADASVARLVVEHAATTAARAAVVVLPDDGAYYKDEDNAAVHENRDYRQSDVERAADAILAASGRLSRGATNVALDKPKYEEREVLTARVTAPYRCWLTVFCPNGITMSASAQLVYQGAKYTYEASTGWASAAANRGLENVRGPAAQPGQQTPPNDPNNPNDPTNPNDPANPDNDPANPDNDPANPNDGRTNPNDGRTNPNEPNDGRTNPNDPDDGRTNPNDGTTNPRPADPELQRRAEELQRALPPNLRDTPVTIDPSLGPTTVRVHYTHDDRGVITGVEIRAGANAQPRHIRDHAQTVRTLKRYEGVAGRARALLQRFNSWLTGNPNAGPGTRAFEARREVEKLNDIIASRQRELEDPNLSPERKRELERELDSYEKQLDYYERLAKEIADEPGTGHIAAEDTFDPGGRGNWLQDEDGIRNNTNLTSKEKEELLGLQGKVPTSEKDLERLVELREKAAGGPLPPEAGNPEHMLDAWIRYQAREKEDGQPKQDFKRWAAGHPSRMRNSQSGVAREAEYRQALADSGHVSRSAVVSVPVRNPDGTVQTNPDGSTKTVNRQVDLLIEGKDGGPDHQVHQVQIKSGEESLTTTARNSGGSSSGSSAHSNKDALVIDGEIVKSGTPVSWVFEKLPSGPLVKEAIDKKVDVVIQVQSPAEKASMLNRLKRAGMTPDQIAKVKFVEGGLPETLAALGY